MNNATVKAYIQDKAVATKHETAEQELARLREENEKLKASFVSGRALSMKIGEKGALSVYGMGRFPVTLYKEQWVKLLGFSEQIQTFIKANESRLKSKADSVIAAVK